MSWQKYHFPIHTPPCLMGSMFVKLISWKHSAIRIWGFPPQNWHQCVFTVCKSVTISLVFMCAAPEKISGLPVCVWCPCRMIECCFLIPNQPFSQKGRRRERSTHMFLFWISLLHPDRLILVRLGADALFSYSIYRHITSQLLFMSIQTNREQRAQLPVCQTGVSVLKSEPLWTIYWRYGLYLCMFLVVREAAVNFYLCVSVGGMTATAGFSPTSALTSRLFLPFHPGSCGNNGLQLNLRVCAT